MHPPIQSTKSYYRRQPLQQIQQTTKETTNTAPALNENNNSEDCDSVLVKQIRSLKLSSNTTTVTSTRASGVSLANIVAGNYPKQQQQQQQALRNNENYSSRVKYYNNSQSQENIQPVAARGRPTSSKYVRNGGSMNHNVNFNNMNMNGTNRYKSNNNGYSNGSNRRHALNNNNSELINKDDLRYTAKYWTSTTTTSTTNTTNTTASTVSIRNSFLFINSGQISLILKY